MDVEDYDGDDAQKQYETIPDDRVFYTLKLFITEDNTIGGAGFHDGKVLKQLGVGPVMAMHAEVTGDVVTRAAIKAVQQLGSLGIAGSLLEQIINHVKENQRDSKDSGEGGDTTAATSAQ